MFSQEARKSLWELFGLVVYLIATLGFSLVWNIPAHVEQEGLADLSCKGPGRNYFRLAGHVVFVLLSTASAAGKQTLGIQACKRPSRHNRKHHLEVMDWTGFGKSHGAAPVHRLWRWVKPIQHLWVTVLAYRWPRAHRSSFHREVEPLSYPGIHGGLVISFNQNVMAMTCDSQARTARGLAASTQARECCRHPVKKSEPWLVGALMEEGWTNWTDAVLLNRIEENAL